MWRNYQTRAFLGYYNVTQRPGGAHKGERRGWACLTAHGPALHAPESGTGAMWYLSAPAVGQTTTPCPCATCRWIDVMQSHAYECPCAPTLPYPLLLSYPLRIRDRALCRANGVSTAPSLLSMPCHCLLDFPPSIPRPLSSIPLHPTLCSRQCPRPSARTIFWVSRTEWMISSGSSRTRPE